MKIEIDTKRDSTDDIKKTIDFLLKFVEQGDILQNNELPTMNEGSFNIFDNPESNHKDKSDDDNDEPITIVEY
ncbi:MAG: hypothetical protein ABIB43_06120 [archaeon]